MKKLILILLLFSFFQGVSQYKKKAKRLTWVDWSDSVAFFSGPEPLIKGFGELSDTLSSIHGGRMIYELKGNYYFINNLADYYFWFVKRYPNLFRGDVASYETFYNEGDNWSMAKYVKENYRGKKFPVKFRFFDHSNGPSFPAPTDAPYNPNFGPETVVRFKN